MAELPDWLREFALSLTYAEIDMIETLRKLGVKPGEVLVRPNPPLPDVPLEQEGAQPASEFQDRIARSIRAGVRRTDHRFKL